MRKRKREREGSDGLRKRAGKKACTYTTSASVLWLTLIASGLRCCFFFPFLFSVTFFVPTSWAYSNLSLSLLFFAHFIKSRLERVSIKEEKRKLVFFLNLFSSVTNWRWVRQRGGGGLAAHATLWVTHWDVAEKRFLFLLLFNPSYYCCSCSCCFYERERKRERERDGYAEGKNRTMLR